MALLPERPELVADGADESADMARAAVLMAFGLGSL